VLIIIVVYFIAKRATIEQLKTLLDKGGDSFKDHFYSQVDNLTCVNDMLDNIQYDLNADRIYIFQYHNGGSNIAGIPFVRCTNTHERCEIGIEPHINTYQNLPIAMYGFRHDLIAAGLTITVADIENIRESDKSGYNLMKAQGIKSLYVKGLFGLDNTPIGFLGIDYIREKKELTSEQLVALEAAVQRLSGCMQVVGCCKG